MSSHSTVAITSDFALDVKGYTCGGQLNEVLGDGKSQQVGIDYGETFRLRVKPLTVLSLAFLALSKHWPIHQLVFFEDYKASLNIFPPPVSTAGEC